jgi:parvulin-like peptidyl-prolyl cis-trans isomerase-like protein
MKRLIREPFMHFLFLGAAIFVANHLISGRADSQPGKIVITQGQITSMVIGFSRTWQRPPTREELERLTRDRVREEVYSREAVAMGLDQDDPVIRRRLQQKLEFVTDDVAALAEPTDAELAAYLKAHTDVFHVDRKFTFSQVYLDPSKHSEHLAQDADQLLIHLQQKGCDVDLYSLGDALLLEHRFEAAPATEISRQFGNKFAAKLGDFPVRRWYGPVESGYGMHLVFMEERTEGRLPELAEVRDAVRREWCNASRLESNEKFFQSLLKHYDVVVEKIDLAKADQKLANAR